VLPIFWKQLQHVPGDQSLAHRIGWCFILLVLYSMIVRHSALFGLARNRPGITLPFVATAALLGINWYVYIWAVNANFIVETSLGYFINPILSVLLGVLFLKEQVRPWQWVAIGIVTTGVVWLTVSYGRLPWIALTLAATFALYGLIRKTATLGALDGLSLEAGILFFPALGYLVYVELTGPGAFGHTGLVTDMLLVAGGLVTAIPLLLFAAGARRVRLVTVGLLQYLAPTMQLIIGVAIYGEPFPTQRLVGFGLIWIALLIYSGEGIVAVRKRNTLIVAD
jgi:chloramphenicol-sensitive protein RarD